MRHRPESLVIVVRNGVADGDRIEVQVPREAVHPIPGRDDERWRGPVQGQRAVWRGWRLLTQAIVRRGIERWMWAKHGIIARVVANDLAAILEDLELYFAACVVR